ncbi:CPBP family intramembrane metalloprotease [Postechiella marina]|uniref:CPBP family intramembrane metalloprotease n=1 Tax=Postechiella marina TaxID=943941 RepID=A0ABP8C2A8_9FLAO
MYIAQAFKGLHEWWRYLLGLVIVSIAWQVIGGIPFFIAVMVKLLGEGGDITNLNESELLSVLEPNLNLFFMLLMFAIGLIALFVVVKYFHKLPLLNFTTSRRKIDWKRFWFIFFLWGIISSSILVVDYYLSPENYVLNFKPVPFLILCVIAMIMIPLQTSFEEYLFRGYLMQGIGAVVKNKWAPLIITSLGFGLLHIANPEVDKLGPIIMIYYIGTGLFLGIITLMDDGLELALGFHAANNLFTALLVTADWTALQTHSVFKDMSDPETMKIAEIIVPVFVIFPILLFILSKKYKWTNWKENLLGTVKELPKEDYKIIN